MKVVCKTVCVFVFRRREDALEYLLLRRTIDRGGNWQPVTGRVEKRERAEDAAQRELMEETGFRAVEFLHLDKVHIYFKPGKRRVCLEPCFGVGVDGAEPRLCNEHDSHAWLDFAEARTRLAHAGLREVLEELHARLLGRATRAGAEEQIVPVAAAAGTGEAESR